MAAYGVGVYGVAVYGPTYPPPARQFIVITRKTDFVVGEPRTHRWRPPMGIAWQETQISVSPPSYQMATTHVETFTFSLADESEATLTGADVLLIDLLTLTEIDGIATLISTVGKTATVLVDAREGMNRRMTYELLVTLAADDEDIEPMQLFIECVAGLNPA